MESLHKSGQLSNMVIFKAPRQIGGENSHATDPGKQKGSHFLESENRDCMPSSCQGKLSHATDPGKPRAAISSSQRIVIPCRLRIGSARQERQPSASLRLRVDPLKGMLRKRCTRSTKRIYQRKGLGLGIPKKSCSSAGLRGRRTLIFVLRCLHELMDQGGER